MIADRTPAVEPLLVDALTAAKMLSVSERTLWSMSVGGELPSVKVRRRRLYRVETLRQWIAERERKGVQP